MGLRARSTALLVSMLGCATPGAGTDDLGSSESETSTSEAETSTSEAETSTSESETSTSESETSTDTSEPALARVLFIGNSYTFVNDLPGLFAAMSDAAGDPRIVDSIAIAGTSVADHVANPQVETTLAEGWDVVVIQGQSVEPIVAYPGFEQAVVELAAMIDEATPGAELVLYETWARQAGNSVLGDLGLSPEQMQQQLSEGYAAAALASGGRVVPVGQAWALALVEAPAIELFAADGSHPSMAGSFLASCVFFGVLLGQPAAQSDYVPEGLAPADADLLEPFADALVFP